MDADKRRTDGPSQMTTALHHGAARFCPDAFIAGDYDRVSVARCSRCRGGLQPIVATAGVLYMYIVQQSVIALHLHAQSAESLSTRR